MGCGQPVAGLTNDKAAIQRIFGLLQPTSRGGTMVHLGLQAGWMTLSPRWRGLRRSNAWGTTTHAGLPLDYRPTADGMAKVIVLVTQGDTDWFDHSRPPSFDYTAFGRVTEGRLGTASGNATPPRLNDRFASLCETIKAQRITVYTVMLGKNRGGQNLYRQCATSSPTHSTPPARPNWPPASRRSAANWPTCGWSSDGGCNLPVFALGFADERHPVPAA